MIESTDKHTCGEAMLASLDPLNPTWMQDLADDFEALQFDVHRHLEAAAGRHGIRLRFANDNGHRTVSVDYRDRAGLLLTGMEYMMGREIDA